MNNGNIDLADLSAKAEEHTENLAALMITYPSTHGVFEENDPRNLRDRSRKRRPGLYGRREHERAGRPVPPRPFGADVCHLNLHKTFCIPHGGGGPGMGPIGVGEHLVEFLPTSIHRYQRDVAKIGGGIVGALWLGRDSPDLVDVHRDDGRARADRRHRIRDPHGELHREPARDVLPGALQRPRAVWSRTNAFSTCVR